VGIRLAPGLCSILSGGKHYDKPSVDIGGWRVWTCSLCRRKRKEPL
jgi:hypothetical protein